MPYTDADRQRAFQREWVNKRRRRYFADKECVVCGATEEAGARLELRWPAGCVGRDGTHRFWTRRWEIVVARAAEADPVCGECAPVYELRVKERRRPAGVLLSGDAA